MKTRATAIAMAFIHLMWEISYAYLEIEMTMLLLKIIKMETSFRPQGDISHIF